MEMPTFKEKAILKINNLIVEYCQYYSLQHRIRENGDIIIAGFDNDIIKPEIPWQPRKEAQIAQKLTTISRQLKVYGGVIPEKLEYCNRISNELQESKEFQETA